MQVVVTQVVVTTVLTRTVLNHVLLYVCIASRLSRPNDRGRRTAHRSHHLGGQPHSRGERLWVPSKDESEVDVKEVTRGPEHEVVQMAVTYGDRWHHQDDDAKSQNVAMQ